MPSDDNPPPKDKGTQSKSQPPKLEQSKNENPNNTKTIFYVIGAVAAVVLLVWIF